MDQVDAVITFFNAAREYAKIETTDYRNTHKPDEIMQRRARARQNYFETYKRLIAHETGKDTKELSS